MTLSRRRQERWAADRRDSTRSSVFSPVRWMRVGTTRAQRGWLVQRSARGMAMVTESTHTPAQGAVLSVRLPTKPARLQQQMVVLRVDALTDLLDLVVARDVAAQRP